MIFPTFAPRRPRYVLREHTPYNIESIMRHRISRILCAAFCCVPLLVSAQSNEKVVSPERLYQEGEALFRQKAYTAAIAPLQQFVRLAGERKNPPQTGEVQEAEYMLVCAAYETRDIRSEALLASFLKKHPDTPHANRLRALMASERFFAEDYESARAYFADTRLDLLSNEERDEMTYRLATCYLKTGELQEAAIWYETVRATSPRHAADCTYYLAYIRYTQGRYDEALQGFAASCHEEKYQTLAPYYIAEIYLLRQDYKKAESTARDYLSAYPNQSYANEMYRIIGASAYHTGRYREAMKAFEQSGTEKHTRRDALYMYGMTCYHLGVYTRVPELLGRVTTEDDALTQNAWLHTGLAYLHMADKNKARMAFEQAATSTTDKQIQEQAAYNYALCLHETSYSAFGESVTAFEKFLNDFPQSPYADRVSSYLVDVYMETRSYEAALQSINRIQSPNRTIQEAKTRILFQLGAQAFANADFPTAIDYFSQSLTVGTGKTEASLYWRGESYYRLGQMSQAAADFQRYLNIATDRKSEMYALAYYNLGYIAFHREDYREAEKNLSYYVQLETGENPAAQADAYNRLGDCCLNGRRFEEATHYYTQAERLGAASGDYALYQLALVSGLQKDYNAKISLLDRLAEKYPNSPYAVNGLYEKGRSYVQRQEGTQAIATFRELLSKYPESPIARKAAAEIGLLYYQSEDYDRAIEAYKQVIHQYPGSEEARLAMRDLKSIYVDANRVDEYAAWVAELPGQAPFEDSEQDSLTYLAAEKVYMKGEIASARTSLERYLQSFPEGAFRLNAHYYLCLIGQQQKEEETVLLHAGKLLEYPDSPYAEEVLPLRAEILFNRKQYAEALADYRLLQSRATTVEHRRLGILGRMRCGVLLKDDIEVIQAATELLADSKLSPELQYEALYYRAKAYLNQHAPQKATADWQALAGDTRTLYGAEAKYRLAQQLYDQGNYAEAEKEVLEFIEQSTPHAYWLARSFVLLSDVYVAMDKPLDARQYLLSLKQNYQADDDIADMIEERLNQLEEKSDNHSIQ